MILVPRIVSDRDLMISISLLLQMIPQYKFINLPIPNLAAQTPFGLLPNVSIKTVKMILFPMCDF